MLADFYRAILPSTGHFALFLGERRQHVWCSSIDELVRKTEQYQDRTDLYFATCSFKEPGSRKGDNADARNTICFDIDAGPEKYAKHGDSVYPTQADALKDLTRWCRAEGVVPQYIVSSGAGLHVYFALDCDMEMADWSPLADAVKAKALADGLRIDPSVTGDMVRVLRPVGSLHKSGAPVTVLANLPKVYSVEELAQKFPPVRAARPARRSSINDDILKPVVVVPRTIHRIVSQCAAMQHVASLGGDVPEPYWRAALGVAKHTHEGVNAAHMLSSGHPDYDPDETEAKFERWSAGPTTCDVFAAENKAACAACPHRGKIKSPISLGAMEASDMPGIEPPPAPTLGAEDSEPQFGSDDAPRAKLPWDGFLPPNVKVRPVPGGFGMFREEMVPKIEDGKATKELVAKEVQFSGVPFWFEGWIESAHDDDPSLLIYASYNATRKLVTRYTMLSKNAARQDTLLAELANRNIHASNEPSKKTLDRFVRDSVERIRANGMRHKVRDRFGLHHDHEGNIFYAHGRRLIYANGNIEDGGIDKKLAGRAESYSISLPYSDTGKWSPDIWDAHIRPNARRYVEHLKATVRDDQPQFKLAIMMSMASPFVAFAQGYVPGPELPPLGFTVSLYSTETGMGKSLALQLAAMAYGLSTLAASKNASNSTVTARNMALSQCGTLPMFMDENADGDTAASMYNSVKNLGNGKADRDRGRQDGSYNPAPSVSLVNLVGTNISVRELVASANETTNAAVMRMLEIDCSSMPKVDSSEGRVESERRAQVADTHGCLGAVVHYAIVRLGWAATNKLVAACCDAAGRVLGDSNEGRIMVKALGAMLALRRVLKAEGLDFWDGAELQEEFKKWYDSSLRFGRVVATAVTTADQLSRMLIDLAGETVVTDHMGGRSKEAPPVHHIGDRMPNVASVRVVREAGEAYVRMERLREWCGAHHIGLSGLLLKAHDEGLLLAAPGEPEGWKRRMDLLRGLRTGTKIQAIVVAINLKRLGMDRVEVPDEAAPVVQINSASA